MSDSEVEFQHDFIKNHPNPKLFQNENFERNGHPGAQWYPKAGLGLFIHWGISSVRGCYDLSWGMIRSAAGSREKNLAQWGLPSPAASVPPAVYWAEAPKFDAGNYDPGQWLSAAAEAGFKYAVLTAKHHDGFALWPSKYGNFNTKNWLAGRDLVGEYVEACRKHGLKAGLYYSPPDWFLDREFMNFSRNPDQTLDYHWNPAELKAAPESHKKAIREYNRLQVEELLTGYGQIDLLWFDGYGGDCITVKRMRELQPHLVINERGRLRGDFCTRGSECRFPEQRRPGWWEYSHTLNDGGWGYRDHEIYKPAGWMLAELGKARSWNGNFIANVAPDSHGSLPDVYYKRMKQIAGWMRINGESVFNAEGTEFWPEKCNVPVTKHENILYLHAHWLVDYAVELREVERPRLVMLNGVEIPYLYDDRILTVWVPPAMQSALTNVIKAVF